MSTTEELKKYLIGEDGFLINPDNNGKTIMLSGTWGAGKTHFWQNEIEVSLSDKLKNKACVYVSLYGKDNIYDIKSEVFLKAYSQLEDNDKYQKIDTAISWLGYGSTIASVVSLGGIKLDTTKVTDKVNEWNELDNLKKAQEAIKNGGVICFDDFERKSKHIDLNDLFGTITQLSLDFNCKVVIILNSDVFENEEANIFKTVKEKTVNKFFYFEPSIEELFGSIYTSAKKYQRLGTHRDEILNVIQETEELNARIYIQVLDNCLEWIDKGYDCKSLAVLILSTTFFIKNYETLDFGGMENDKKQHKIIKYYLDEGYYDIAYFLQNTAPQLFSSEKSCVCKEVIQIMNSDLNKSKKEDKEIKSDDYYNRQNKIFHENKILFRDFIFYVYVLKINERIDSYKFDKINIFIKTGILPKQGDTNILKKGNN